MLTLLIAFLAVSALSCAALAFLVHDLTKLCEGLDNDRNERNDDV
jgi:hypothetical protein